MAPNSESYRPLIKAEPSAAPQHHGSNNAMSNAFASSDWNKRRVSFPGDPTYSRAAVFTVFFFPALGGLLFGYDIGATSGVLTQLESSSLSGVEWWSTVSNSSLLQGVITSTGVGGAMVGSLICFRIGDAIGRRKTILTAAVLFLMGSIIEAMSGVSSWSAAKGISTLLLGRITYGLGCGFAMHGAPAYIGEMSPPSVRGVLVSMKEVFIVLGILMGYFIGWCLEEMEGGWRTVYATAVVPAFVMFCGMYLMPPSARWLVLRGRNDEARRSLQYVTPDVSELAIAEIQASASKADQSKDISLSALWGPSCKHALIAGVGLVILQQITGQPSVLYYADTIFDDVGMSSLSSVLTGLFKLVATLIAVFTVDNHGRRKLLNIGCCLMLVALVCLGVAFMFSYTSADDCNAIVEADTCADNSSCSWSTGCLCESSATDCVCCDISGLTFQKTAILLAMFLYIGGYQVGFGPVSWLIISEVFPLDLRGKAISIAVVANFASNLVVTLLFPTELEIIGSALTFWIFAVITVGALYFINSRVPETKGLSLEQIEQLFLRRNRQELLVDDP